MSEGGRKVWNREQLLALNDGAVIRARTETMDGPELNPTVLEWSTICQGFHSFGTELHFDVVDEYPIEVIWEPTDGD